mmetsp:Transcript_22191/g.51184  ORF Transcript_22191/g.51184 Transcript_22191/m.51184 type:complete len:185 (+) Transcript_22191:3-557(+)
MDNHAPLLEWAKRENISLDLDSAKPAKIVMVELFSVLLWLNMGSFCEIDANKDGVLTPDEIRERASLVFGETVADLVVENIMSVADLDKSGTIKPMEMMIVSYVAMDMLDHVVTEQEALVMQKVVLEVMADDPSISSSSSSSHAQVSKWVQKLLQHLDASQDGKISRQEAMRALGEVTRKSLLR